MKGALVLVILICTWAAKAQSIVNLAAEVKGEMIVVTYDLVGVPGDRYNVSIYSSHNNFSAPLKLVNGDLGKGITEGKGKKIEWNAKAELGGFKGNLSFEIHADVIAPLTILSNPPSVKRGKATNITWRGGDKNQNVTLELLKGGVVESTLGSANNDTYSWTVPMNQKVGQDFQIRLVNGNESVTSKNFAIKHKIPTAVKIAPAAILLIVLTLPSKKTPTSSSNPVLPRPPDLDLN